MPAPLDLTGDCYPFYKEHLIISADTFACAKRTVPLFCHQVTTSDYQGMPIGKMQSGKTRTFSNILTVAFDNGYDMAIVFSKSSSSFIEQSNKRLHSEFVHFVNDRDLEGDVIMHEPKFYGEKSPPAVYTSESI